MNSGELIELFYNRTYEKFVNKQILDDKNYIVPRQQLINYVHELVNIPFIDYIDYIKQNENDRRLNPQDITQFSSFSSCELEMCKALLWANNPGCKYIDIGRLFPNKLFSRSESAYWRYGEIHIKASRQLGLTFEYYNYWYLGCLGYIYPELEKSLRLQLLARTITRNRLYQQILIDIMEHDVNPEEYINIFPNFNFKRCKRSVYYFLNICLDICRKEGIKVHNLIKRYEPPKGSNQDDNILEISKRTDRYLLDICREPLLPADEEVELALKIRKGDVNARNKLVSAYMRYVIGLAKQYLHKGLEFEDLLNEGFLGLIKAAENFDETRGYRLIHYAIWWIRRYLSDAIVTDSTLIKYPLNVRTLHRRLNDFKAKYEHQYGFMPPINKRDIIDKHEIKSYIKSLPDNLRDTCIPYENSDAIEDTHNDISDYEENDNNNYYVRSLLSHLSKRESEILIRIYGIGVREETLESIGETFGLTRERVRQVKEKAIKKLREMISAATTERQLTEILSAQNKEDANCNIRSIKSLETQTLKDVKKTFSQYNTNVVQHAQVVKNDKVRLPSESLSINTSVNTNNYNVVNYANKCIIYDYKKKRVYSSTGCIKEFNTSFYRMSLTFTFFSVCLIKKNSEGYFYNGDKLILANQTSLLYQRLKNKDYFDLIEEIEPSERIIKVGGCWFDEYGNVVSIKTGQMGAFFDYEKNTKGLGAVNKNSKPENKQNNLKALNVQGKSVKQTTLTYNTNVFNWKVGDSVYLQSLFSGHVTIDESPSYVFRKKILFIFIDNETKNSIHYFDKNEYTIATNAPNLEMNMQRKYGKKKPRILVFLCNADGAVSFFDEVDIKRVGSDYIQFLSII
jgi:RNA polymerase primary sigma factor